MHHYYHIAEIMTIYLLPVRFTLPFYDVINILSLPLKELPLAFLVRQVWW